MYCKKCGKELRDDGQFCWNCGNKIEIKEEKNEPVVEVEKNVPEEIRCWNCKEEIDKRCDVCPKCHMRVRIIVPKNPGIAAVLSFFVPGLGHIYNGKIAIGVTTTIIVIFLVGITALLARSYGVKYGIIALAIVVILWIYSVHSSYDVAENMNDKQYK
jgi:TM2 domain-containing membrane protein YozV